MKGMVRIFKCHERSFSCIYGIANVLRYAMMEEFPALRGETDTRRGRNGNVVGGDMWNWESFLRLFPPSAGERQNILRASLCEVPADRCMD